MNKKNVKNVLHLCSSVLILPTVTCTISVPWNAAPESHGSLKPPYQATSNNTVVTISRPIVPTVCQSATGRTRVGDVDVDVVPFVRLGVLGRSSHVHLARLTQLSVADLNAKRTSRDRLAFLSHLHRVATLLLRLKADHSFNDNQSINK